MDLLSTVRKTGSRGGVNFSWDDVATSAHRENYLGHSVKAPVGRWAQGKDLTWYAKADPTAADSNETEEERAARERREEIRKIKEAEEDAIARALGLPVPTRNVTGANAVAVDDSKVSEPQAAPDGKEVSNDRKATRDSDPRKDDRDRHRHRDSDRRHHSRRHRSRSRSRDRERERDRRHHRDRDRSRDRRGDNPTSTKERDRRHHRRRSRSPDSRRYGTRDRYDDDLRRGQDHQKRRERSRSRSRDRERDGHNDRNRRDR